MTGELTLKAVRLTHHESAGRRMPQCCWTQSDWGTWVSLARHGRTLCSATPTTNAITIQGQSKAAQPALRAEHTPEQSLLNAGPDNAMAQAHTRSTYTRWGKDVRTPSLLRTLSFRLRVSNAIPPQSQRRQAFEACLILCTQPCPSHRSWHRKHMSCRGRRELHLKQICKTLR